MRAYSLPDPVNRAAIWITTIVIAALATPKDKEGIEKSKGWYRLKTVTIMNAKTPAAMDPFKPLSFAILSRKSFTTLPLGHPRQKTEVWQAAEIQLSRARTGGWPTGPATATCYASATNFSVPTRVAEAPVSVGWFTPSSTGTSAKSNGPTPSRQATLTPYWLLFDRRWWWV